MSQAPIFQVLPLRNLFDEQAFADSVQQSSLGGEYDENTRTRVSLLALATSTASAGGIDRSGQWITPIFDKGNVVQFSIGSVDPDVTGSLGTTDSATRYNPVSFSIKQAITDKC